MTPELYKTTIHKAKRQAPSHFRAQTWHKTKVLGLYERLAMSQLTQVVVPLAPQQKMTSSWAIPALTD